VRIPLKEDDPFSKEINNAFEDIRRAHFEAVRPQLETTMVHAMLGDGSITQTKVFEPERVSSLYKKMIFSLEEWISTGVSRSNTDDLHRIYCQFAQDVGRYHLSGYFGIQFHSLQYYRVDNRVIDIQRQLAHVAEQASQTFDIMAHKGNAVIQKELEGLGYADLGFEGLFAKLFEDDKLVRYLESKASPVENEFPQFEELHSKKKELFAELYGLLIELQQISCVSIDHDKLMQGEEGVTAYLDIEIIKNQKSKERDAYINTKKVPKEDTIQIVSKLKSISRALQNLANS